jgi:dynein heavy chain 2
MLKAARKNLLKERKGLNSALEEGAERELVVQALRLNTLSKLTFADCTRFDSLVRDVFPGVRFTSSGYEELTAALKESFSDLGLLCNENQVRHIYSILHRHISVQIVVGIKEIKLGHNWS